MIVVALMLILIGALSGAAVLWVQDASWWMIALGYVGGGWAGLLLGLPLTLGVRALMRLCGIVMPLPQGRQRAWAVPQEAPRSARRKAPTSLGR